MQWSFSRRTLIVLVVTGVVIAVAGLALSRALGDGLDPLSPSNPATLAGAIGLLVGIAFEVAARLGNHCPKCRAEMRHLAHDGGRVGINVPILDYTARRCQECGHDRD